MNKENYKKAIGQIHASEELKQNTFEKIKNSKEKNKILPFKKFLAACAVVAIVFSGTALYFENKPNKELPNNTEPPVTIAKKIKNDLPRFENAEQLKEVLQKNNTNRYFNELESVTLTDAVVEAPTAGDTKKEMNNEQAESDYSKTNTQVENVDEADIVKTDGKYIYYVSNEKVYIIEASNLKIISTIEIEEKDEKFYPRELFINENKLIVLGNQEEGYHDVTQTNKVGITEDVARVNVSNISKVIVYDISDKTKPAKKREVGVEGNYINSRMIGENVYFISTKGAYYYDNLKEEELTPKVQDTATEEKERYIACTDIAYFKGSSNYSYMVVAGFNINNNEEMNTETFFGANDTIYASEDNLYIAQTNYGSGLFNKANSEIYKFNLIDSQIALQGKVEIKGNLNNQFSMDEYDGNLRVATTYGYDEDAENLLYVLDKDLKEIGKIENLAKGEKIYSVRFIGKIGYIVTFEQIDPLFVIDLSDPTNPNVKGELKIPGYSSYLHPYDETHIIGIGYNTKSNGYGGVTNSNMKMSMFDVSDVENPKEMFNVSIGGTHASSEVLYNHKALFFNKNKNLIGFPISTNTTEWSNYKDGFVIYKIDLQNGFEKHGEILIDEKDYMSRIRRSIYIGDVLFTLSENSVISYDLNTFNKINELELE